tara:strand:- start:31 stop:597 length:567 start_codon:yes stop_codon:yes gene_type:complete
MNVLDFVLKIDNVLPHETCDELIKLFEESIYKDRMERQGYPNWTNLWICNDYPEVDQKLQNVYMTVARGYQTWLGVYGDHFNTNTFKFEGTNMKRYIGGTDDMYKRHADVGTLGTCKRYLAMLFYLNDDFEGGETIFYPEMSIRPKKGSVVVFPPYWLFPHEGTPVIKGRKYIMSNYCLLDNADNGYS